MPHDIADIDGKPAMFYRGETPWHELGTKLDKPPTASEAIRAASLDWQVLKLPCFTKVGSRYQDIPDRFVIARYAGKRSRRLNILGHVGRMYVPLQNKEAFDWFDPIVEQGAATYETAGALGKGERVWILAKLPDVIQVTSQDVVDKYLLLSNSHDGLSSVQVRFTPIRVVCQNTLSMALQGGYGFRARVQHTAALHRNLGDVAAKLKLILQGFANIETSFRTMAAINMTGSRMNTYLANVFPLPSDSENEPAKDRIMKMRESSLGLFESGIGSDLPKVRGTLWAAYNGVVELFDHHLYQRMPPSRRLDNAWFGEGSLVKIRAYKSAMKLADAWRN